MKYVIGTIIWAALGISWAGAQNDAKDTAAVVAPKDTVVADSAVVKKKKRNKNDDDDVLDTELPVAVTITQVKKPFQYKLGVDGLFSEGNVNRKLLTTRGTFALVKEKYDFSLTPSYIYGETNSQLAETEYSLSSFSHVFHQRKIYGFGLALGEHSRLRGIDERWQAGAGAGFHIFNTEHFTLSFTNGILYEMTDFKNGTFIETWRNSARIKGRFSLFQKHLKVFHETYIQPSIIVLTNMRWRTLVTMEIPVNKHISLRAVIENSYESVVLEGRKPNDLRITFGFAITNF